MTEVTVRQLADDVGTDVERLLVQLSEAGLPHRDADEAISDEDKAHLLNHLRRLHGKTEAKRKKITVKRKSVSELRVGKKKSVTVEVRKRRTYVSAGTARSTAEESGDDEQRMAAEKQALLEEAKRRQAELDDSLRVEQEAREKEEALRKARPPEKPKPKPEEALEVVEEAPKVEPVAPPPAELVEPGTVPPSPGKGTGRKQSRKKEERGRSDREELHVASEKRGRRRKKSRVRTSAPSGPQTHGFQKPTAPIVREVTIPDTISVGDLAQKMSIKATDLIKAMMNLGSMVTINQVVDQETAAIVVEELGHVPKLLKDSDLEAVALQTSDTDEREEHPRSPVVTIMGHVDHGKTSLLDYIRRSKVVEGEAGGITQHIGAYRVESDSGSITFLDTPGHAAFTAMRARGAKSTDLVILVVAADDGVMPQTVEAVQHSKAAGVPIIVAVNKMDRQEAEPERVMQDLANHEVIPEEWGGDTMFVKVSAMTGEGVDALLEAILLQAEVLELKAPAEGSAAGVVIESRLDRGRGPVATVLVQSGMLNKGDMLLAGEEFGRVRLLYDEHGNEVSEAGPSTPVEVLGLSGPPGAGDEALVVPDDRKAREVADLRKAKTREIRLARQQAGKLENMFDRMTESETSNVNLVVKADVQGSVEALRDALTALSNDEVKVNVVGSGTGGISERDVSLAIAAGAIVIGFNVRADSAARKLVEAESVDLHYFSIIYEVIDTIKAAVSGLLAPEIREQIVGIAEVRDVFRSRRLGDIAGCMVSDGVVKRSNPIRVLRDNVVIYEGELESLRRFKDDVNEVRSGTECGIGVKNYNDVKVGDQIEVFERIEVARTA